MRLLVHYVAAVFGLLIYGVQVCPFLESMPSLLLGSIILGWFVLALALRFFILPRYVDTAPLLVRPGRQFILEFCMVAGAGAGIAAFNTVVYNFPLASGLKILLGSLLFSFFAGADMALQRERENIRESGLHSSPPAKLFPVTRKFMLSSLAGMILVSTVLILVIVKDLDWLVTAGSDPENLLMASFSVAGEIVFIMAVLIAMTLNLIISYSRNLKLLFANQTGVLEDVALGKLDRKIPVATGDEFGLIAGRTNEMIDGLRHRIELISAMEVAEEVQGNLLPVEFPFMESMEVAGRSIYSDETGGDYYDVFPLPSDKEDEKNTLFAIGDVTGHGVGAALLMAAGRAYLRMAAQTPIGLDGICAQVNNRLYHDVGNSGRFMTLFLLAVREEQTSDGTATTLSWVRGGHDPAILYDPGTDEFSELDGKGMALGVLEGFEFQESSRPAPAPGSVLLIGTDGIWEAHTENVPGGEVKTLEENMFGKERVRQILRAQAHRTAEEIVQAILDELSAFLGPVKAEDDITLMIFKFKGPQT